MKSRPITNKYPPYIRDPKSFEQNTFTGISYVISFMGHTFEITSGELYSYEEWYQYEDEYWEPLNKPVLVEEEETRCHSYPVSMDGEYYLPWLVAAALTSNGREECWLARRSESEVIAELIRLRSVLEKDGYGALKHEVNELVNPTPVAFGETHDGLDWWLNSPGRYSSSWTVSVRFNPESPFKFSTEAEAREFLALISAETKEVDSQGRQPYLFY
jgi:hypothetical protein